MIIFQLLTVMGSTRQIFPKKNERFLDDETVLWRYVPLKTLFLYLTETIFIPSVEKLRQGDPFEGEFYFETTRFNKTLQERYGHEYEKVLKWLEDQFSPTELMRIKRQTGLKYVDDYKARCREKHYFDFLRKTRYAWCWFASPTESAAMWNVYGSHGVAIASTIGKVRNALSQAENNFAFGRLRYVTVENGKTTDLNFKDSEDAQLILEPHFLKRNEYASENEVRFLTTSNEHEHNPGIFIPGIKPAEWIQEIRLWPKLDSSEASSLKEAIKKRVFPS